jgi:hypothetical protein
MHLPKRPKTTSWASSTVTVVTAERQPYLSIVATTRNDDHGGDALARTQIFLDALAAQCERHGLDAELVLVEWNPPADRTGLRDALRWPAPGNHFEARIIEVPAEIHSRLENSDQLPLFQMIAKNVGIRRARAPFVLATNIDLIFSDELMQFLAERSLDPSLLYRADRYDVDVGIPVAPLDEQLEWCEQHLIRINRRDGTEEVRTGRFYRIYPTWLVSSRQLIRTAKQKLRSKPSSSRGATQSRGVVRVTDRRAPTIRQLVRYGWYADRAIMRLHLNACGDFTLMSQEGWAAAGAYPELELFSMFIDALVMYQAHYAGLRETLLPYRLYHMEHSGGFRPDEAGLDELNSRLERDAIPQITYRQLLDWVIQMYRTKKQAFTGPSSWGLADERLPEQLAVRRAEPVAVDVAHEPRVAV